jgi:hypothetical protein
MSEDINMSRARPVTRSSSKRSVGQLVSEFDTQQIVSTEYANRNMWEWRKHRQEFRRLLARSRKECAISAAL